MLTLLFTAIAGSTALAERLGDERYVALLREDAEVVAGAITRANGRVVKHLGDGFMAVFSSPREAINCALSIHEMQATAALDARVSNRIGLHAGEVVAVAGDFLGREVQLAALVAAQAEAGEVLVSPTVRSLLEGSGEFAFKGHDPVELRNLGTHTLSAVSRA